MKIDAQAGQAISNTNANLQPELPLNPSLSTAPTNSTFGERFTQLLTNYQDKWSSIESRSTEKLKVLAPQSAELFSIQREMSALSLETDVLSRIADGVATSVRKIQQLQG